MAGIGIHYAKTGKGIEVLEKRSGDLPRKVRSALLPAYREFITKHADAGTAELYSRELRRILGEPAS